MLHINLRTISKFNLIFILFLILYLLLGIYLLKYYQFDPISRDLISIMSIAKIYAAGEVNNAINGYWGPMFSWLLVPFIISNPTPQFTLYSTKILTVIIGFFTIIGVRFLSYRFEIEEDVRTALLFPVIFIILYFALRLNPVDLLLLCFLVYYMYFIYSPKYSLNWYNGMLCGVLGALAYLTKSFAFPFFLAHFLLFNILHYFKNTESKKDLLKKQKKGVLKNLILGLAVFFVISGFWTGVISEKYDYLTFGTSGEYNLDEIGPIQRELGSPIWHGFIEPSNINATSAWEDPTYLKVRSWNPLESWSSFTYELNNTNNNILKTIGFLDQFTYFSLFIIISYIILLIKPFKKIFSNPNIIYPLLTIIIFIAVYILIFVEFRYLYLVYMLLIWMGGYLLHLLFLNKSCTKTRKYVILSVFIVSLLILPVTTLIQEKDSGKLTYDLANDIGSQYHIQGNIASNDRYMESLFLSYLWGSQYYGTSLKNWHNISDSKLEQNLENYHINYYLYWGDSRDNLQLLSRYKEITGGKIKNLKIFYINQS